MSASGTLIQELPMEPSATGEGDNKILKKLEVIEIVRPRGERGIGSSVAPLFASFVLQDQTTGGAYLLTALLPNLQHEPSHPNYQLPPRGV